MDSMFCNQCGNIMMWYQSIDGNIMRCSMGHKGVENAEKLPDVDDPHPGPSFINRNSVHDPTILRTTAVGCVDPTCDRELLVFHIDSSMTRGYMCPVHGLRAPPEKDQESEPVGVEEAKDGSSEEGSLEEADDGSSEEESIEEAQDGSSEEGSIEEAGDGSSEESSSESLEVGSTEEGTEEATEEESSLDE